MKRDLEAMAQEEFDLLVIGGGIHGTGIARDAALRGLKVALVEKEDFGYGTTSRSTRLIHGGLRYLELLDFRLVREALRERELLLKIAPHLVKPLPFLLPVYREGRHGPIKLRLGLWLYDLLSWDKSLPAHRRLSPREVLLEEPGLRAEGLRMGLLYSDAQVAFPERLCLENALDAAQHGARIANHAEVVSFLRARKGRIVGVAVRDRLDGQEHELRAQITVNAAGPWVDRLNEGLQLEKQLRLSKGIHLVTPPLTHHAVALPSRDGRLIFVIPWREYTLIGTTDTDFEDGLDELQAEPLEVAYLLEEVGRYFRQAPLEVLLTVAGVRSLLRVGEVASWRVPREHRIVDHEKEGAPGLLSLVGGKLTTYRELARRVVDEVLRKLGEHNRHCETGRRPLPGAEGLDAQRKKALLSRAQRLGLDDAQGDHLLALYGVRAERVLELIEHSPQLGERLVPDAPDVVAQVVLGVREEMVRSSADFLLRRTGLGLRPGLGLDALPRVAKLLEQELSWPPERREVDRAVYRAQVALLEAGWGKGEASERTTHKGKGSESP